LHDALPIFSLPAERVIKVLNEIIFWRGKPMKIRVDNGPEFISNALQKWAKDNEIKLKFIQPGKPTQNAYVERFNRFFREDILDAYLFNDLSERSEEHTSELQSRENLVCRLLLEKK